MSKKLTINEIEQRISQRFPQEKFEIIKYEGTGKFGQIKCLNCNQIISISKFSNFFAKNKRYGCKQCHGFWRQREEVLKEIEKKYDILDTQIKKAHTYYHVKCKNCGHERTTSLNNFKKNLLCGCQTLVYRNRTGQEFLKEANRYYNNQLALIGEYKDQTTKVLLKHIPCGMIWKVRPSDIIHGKSHCPKCRTYESLGVKKIKEYLINNNIVFIQEAPLADSRQRFDFFLPELNIAIEYNGVQHYKYTKFFHKNLEGFLEYQKRDIKKAEYCKKNKIKLIVISYKEDNDIETILNSKFND